MEGWGLVGDLFGMVCLFVCLFVCLLRGGGRVYKV